MNTYNLFFSCCIVLYTFFNAKIFLPQRKHLILTIINIFLSTFSIYLLFSYQSPLITFIILNIIIIIFLINVFTKNKQELFSIIYLNYIIPFIFETLMLFILESLNISNNCPILLYIFSYCLALFFNYIFKDHLLYFLFIKKKKKNYSIPSIILNILLISIILFLHFPNTLNNFTYHNIAYLFLIYIIIELALSLLTEKQEAKNFIQNYQNIVEYSEFTEQLLFEYKSFIHEYKNKLIIIKSLTKPSNKELHEYLNSILNEKIDNNYHWLMEIKNIPLPGIKGLINYKLLKMKELNIEVEVFVSEELANLKNNQLNSKEKQDLYTILGVFLDNALEASVESKEKIVSIHLYKENNEIHIILANTFKCVNLELLDRKGYSSKGKNHGIGLFLVKEIIKHSDKIKKETKIINNFFVQKIIAKI